jgi:hypothetical protein
MKKLTFTNAKNTLTRDEMKKIMAGSGSITCQQFYNETGCYPSTGGHTCTGRNGNTVQAATDTGSC